jgi:hypothetical protein
MDEAQVVFRAVPDSRVLEPCGPASLVIERDVDDVRTLSSRCEAE